MHPTIQNIQDNIALGDENLIAAILAEDVLFSPPTYWSNWRGREPVAAILGHVTRIFEDFRYRRIIGGGNDWALEFQCRIGGLDAVGVDLLTLGADGLVTEFEVVMRPHKSVGALREAMAASTGADPRFAGFQSARCRRRSFEIFRPKNLIRAPVLISDHTSALARLLP